MYRTVLCNENSLTGFDTLVHMHKLCVKPCLTILAYYNHPNHITLHVFQLLYWL